MRFGSTSEIRDKERGDKERGDKARGNSSKFKVKQRILNLPSNPKLFKPETRNPKQETRNKKPSQHIN